jgi:cytochrome c oxidase cbb3-type subunit 3
MNKRALILVGFLAQSGCDSSRGDVREWTPADHDQPSSSQAQAPQVSARPDAPETDATLIDLAWQKNCVQCHGARGRGDGPQGPMVRAPDLTRAEWQERVSDQEIAEVIRKGRNKMPAFDLSPPIIDGLVKRIRGARPRP